MKKPSDLHKNILVIVAGFLVLGLIFKTKSQYFYYGASAIAVLTLLSESLAKGLNWLWLKLALGLGWINSRILLSVVYFLFLMPIALVSRLFTKDPLLLKAKSRNSIYTVRDHTYSKEDLENIW